jgi:hypothetical protein
LIKEQRDEYRNQRHPEDSQQIWQCDDARGHRESDGAQIQHRYFGGTAITNWQDDGT